MISMKRFLAAAAAALSLAWLLPACATAQTSGTIKVVGTCGTAVYIAGKMAYPTQDTSGNVCVTGSLSANLNPVVVSTTDKSGSIAAGGTAQPGIALNASRKGWCIQNPSSATAEGIVTAESLWIRVNGTAAANVGTELTPGNQACNAPGIIDTAAISVFAATTAHKFNGFEAQ